MTDDEHDIEQRVARIVLVAGVTLWAANALLHWWLAPPLGHDEARHALDARDILEGRPIRFIYTGGGMTSIALPGLIAGATERWLRLVPTLLCGGFLASVWYAARAICDSTTAAWTVGVLAGGRGFVLFGTELLSDLPSAACLLLAVAVLAVELPRPTGPRWRLVLAAPLCIAAFHIRFGSCIPIAVIAVVFAWVARASGCLRARPVLVTVAGAGVGFVPHLLWSIHLTGSPLGVLRESGRIPPAPSHYLGYVERPLAHYGFLVAALAVVGLLAARRRWKISALQWIAFGQLAILTLTTEAQARYAFFATSLLVILGVDFVAHVVRQSSDRPRTVATAAALVLVGGSWGMVLRDTVRYRRFRTNGAAYAMMAARAIAADRDPRQSCEVMSPDTTRLEWYSGCRSVLVFGGSARQYLVHLGRAAIPSLTDRHVAFVPGMFDVIRVR
jgi:hypothetical protein